MRILSGCLSVSLTVVLAGSSLHAQTAIAAAGQDARDSDDASTSAQAVSVSAVRIVRLSEIRGEAELDRNTGNGFEPAFTNLPITQQSRLRTNQGVAEVEFEDNSSLRLTPGTVVDFPQLGRTSTGATLSTIRVVKGAVYVSLSGSRSKAAPNQFTITFGEEAQRQTLTLAPSTHVELSLGNPDSKLAVFDGSVDVQHGASTITVAKKKQLVFEPGNAAAPTFLTRVEKGPFDDWDKSQAEYHQRYANAAFGLNSTYGTSDLNYYGSFAELPGCGNVWRPYFASAAFDPFANGTWAWYPGAGYSWVSPYPWGWTPFHYGSWQQCGAGGWGWRPGGQWIGLRNAPMHPRPLSDPIRRPTGSKPPLPTASGHPSTVVVSTRTPSFSRLVDSETFVFSKDSAGLGVPRQTFGHLGKTSSNVAQHGAVVTSVNSAPSPLPSSFGATPGNQQIRPGAGNSSVRSPSNFGNNSANGHATNTSSTHNSSSAFSTGTSASEFSGSHASAPPAAAPAPASSGPAPAAPQSSSHR